MSEVIKWGQFGNEFMLMTEDKYGLVQIEHDGLVCAQIGRRFGEKPSPRKLMPYFEDYHHAKWLDGVEEAKKWVEDQLKVTVPDEAAMVLALIAEIERLQVIENYYIGNELKQKKSEAAND